jgi:hypothetical protein
MLHSSPLSVPPTTLLPPLSLYTQTHAPTHLCGHTQDLLPGLLQADAQLVLDQLPASQDSNVLQVGGLALTKPWGLDGNNLQGATQLVDNLQGDGIQCPGRVKLGHSS